MGLRSIRTQLRRHIPTAKGPLPYMLIQCEDGSGPAHVVTPDSRGSLRFESVEEAEAFLEAEGVPRALYGEKEIEDPYEWSRRYGSDSRSVG